MSKIFYFAIWILALGSLNNSQATRPNSFTNKECELLLFRLTTNDFGVQRGFLEYYKSFREPLIRDVSSLKSDDTWIDVGSGLAVVQLEYTHGKVPVYVEQYFKDNDVPYSLPAVESRANTIAIGYKRPSLSDRDLEKGYGKLVEQALKKPSPKFKYLEGRFIETIPLSELPKAKILTDLFGAMSYSVRPDIVLNKYINILKDEGTLYLELGSEQTTMIQAEGRTLTLAKWIEKIDGIELTPFVYETIDGPVKSSRRFILKRTKSADQIKIPKLNLIKLIDDKPPERDFIQE